MTPELIDAITTSTYWIAIGVTALLVGLVVGLHYEVLQQLNRRMPGWDLSPHPRILLMMFCVLGAHIIEIWLFGIGIYSVVQLPGMGAVVGADGFRLLDAIYLSATTFSTLGYGDLVPRGPVRFLVGTESLVGLLLIAWSASFAYLEMAKFWQLPVVRRTDAPE